MRKEYIKEVPITRQFYAKIMESRQKVARFTLSRQKMNHARLVEIIETELGALHEGNIARYHIRPLEFAVWHRGWN